MQNLGSPGNCLRALSVRALPIFLIACAPTDEQPVARDLQRLVDSVAGREVNPERWVVAEAQSRDRRWRVVRWDDQALGVVESAVLPKGTSASAPSGAWREVLDLKALPGGEPALLITASTSSGTSEQLSEFQLFGVADGRVRKVWAGVSENRAFAPDLGGVERVGSVSLSERGDTLYHSIASESSSPKGPVVRADSITTYCWSTTSRTYHVCLGPSADSPGNNAQVH